ALPISWYRLLERSATHTLPFPSTWSPCGKLNWPGSRPARSLPACATNLPFLSNFTTRLLQYPSDTKMLPCGSQATSVGRQKMYFCAGGLGPAVVATAPSTAGGLRPSTIRNLPSGLHFVAVFVPSATVQILSCASTRTAAANSKL